MRINTINNINFGYKSVLKDEWKHNPVMQEHVKFGLYGGELSKDTITLEHLKPHSKGGANELCNYALATAKNNKERGNSPLNQFLNKDMFNKYIEQFKGWTAQLFDNKQYIEEITETVAKEGVKL